MTAPGLQTPDRGLGFGRALQTGPALRFLIAFGEAREFVSTRHVGIAIEAIALVRLARRQVVKSAMLEFEDGAFSCAIRHVSDTGAAYWHTV